LVEIGAKMHFLGEKRRSGADLLEKQRFLLCFLDFQKVPEKYFRPNDFFSEISTRLCALTTNGDLQFAAVEK